MSDGTSTTSTWQFNLNVVGCQSRLEIQIFISQHALYVVLDHVRCAFLRELLSVRQNF